MVNPDASAVLDGNAIVIDNFADSKVTKNNVGRINDRNTSTSDLGALPNADN